MLALEVIETRAGEVTRLEGGDQRVGVVQRGAGRVDVDRARFHARELVGADQPGRLRRHHRVHRNDIRFREQVVERVGCFGVVRVVGDDLHAETLEAPLRRPSDGAEPDDPGRTPASCQAR